MNEQHNKNTDNNDNPTKPNLHRTHLQLRRTNKRQTKRTRTTTKNNRQVYAITAIAILLSFGFLFQYTERFGEPGTDAQRNLNLAKNLNETGKYKLDSPIAKKIDVYGADSTKEYSQHPPVLPLLVAGMWHITKNYFFAGRAVILLATAFTLLGTFLIVMLITKNEAYGLLSMITIGISPGFSSAATKIEHDMLLSLGLIILIIASLFLNQKKIKSKAFLVFALFFNALTKISGLTSTIITSAYWLKQKKAFKPIIFTIIVLMAFVVLIGYGDQTLWKETIGWQNTIQFFRVSHWAFYIVKLPEFSIAPIAIMGLLSLPLALKKKETKLMAWLLIGNFVALNFASAQLTRFAFHLIPLLTILGFWGIKQYAENYFLRIIEIVNRKTKRCEM